MIYLAAPYSHPDLGVVEERIQRFFEIDLRMAAQGVHTISPLYKTLIARSLSVELDLSYEAWEEYCIALMRLCSSVRVLMFPGWELSKGVTAEIHLAERLGLPIEYIDPDLFMRYSS